MAEKDYSFPEKIWITGGILALIVVTLFLIKTTFSVILLVIAGTLIAVYFWGLGVFIEKKNSMSFVDGPIDFYFWHFNHSRTDVLVNWC